MSTMDSAPRALQRGLQVLELLAARPDGLGFAALAEALGTSDSATHRLLQGLSSLGYLEKAASGRYVAGPACAGLRSADSGLERLTRLARPFVRRLSRRTTNTTLLIGCTGPHMIVLDRCEHEDSMALQPIGFVADNFRHPPWGWLFRTPTELAGLPRSDAPTLRTIRGQLAELDERGWVVRYQDDRRRLAAPLRDADGRCIAALAVGGTPTSLPDAVLPEVGEELRLATASIQRLATG